MVQLFLTCACDYCDYGVPKEKLHRGFIVHLKTKLDVHEEYVFRSRADVQRWATAAGREDEFNDIREVFSLMPFRWILSRGTLRDVVLADNMHEVFPNHKFEPLPHRVWLMPDEITQQMEQLRT